MKVCILVIGFLIFHASADGQFLEFGIGTGCFSYAGDLNRNPINNDLNIGATGSFWLNLSEYTSFRTYLTYGSISGSDEETTFDALGEVRLQKFNRKLFEIGGVSEYYFLDFRNAQSSIKWSPFIFIGIGLSKFDIQNEEDDFTKFQISIPFGIGIKKLIGKKFALSFEIGARKTFTDRIDGIEDGEQTVKNFSFGHPNSMDWYFFSGISISYIVHKIQCPFPYIPNKNISRR